MKSNLFAESSRRNVFRVAGIYAVVGWLLAQVATTLEAAVGLPAWFDGMVISLLLIGFPIAVVLAWAFEITPQGVKRAADVPIDQSITDQTGRKLDYAILAGLVLLAGITVWQQITKPEVMYVAEDNATPVSMSGEAGVKVESDVESSPAAAPAPPVDDASIAVLPFADLAPESDQGYFADGISEEILNALTRVEGLAVASRTSAFQFKGREIGIPEIAQTLAVRHVLEGSVRKAGNSLRITAQLIDASNDRHIWSDTYDRPLTAENVFQIQDEIAVAITGALGVAMNLGAEHLVTSVGATDDMDAYELYLEARALYHPREELDRADELLGRALEQDPTFARAWELRSPIPTLAIEYGDSTEPLEQAEARSRQYAERALALNPQSSLALASLGRLIMDAGTDMRGFADWAVALEYFERAIKADPNNASAYLWRANSLEALGFVEEALAGYERCVEIEPLYLPCRSNRPFSLMALGRFDEALALHKEDLARGIANYGFGLVDL